jgi:sacsin
LVCELRWKQSKWPPFDCLYVCALQNAEDNNYGPGVTPSLELVLTNQDVADVGASATLLVFNNETGFQEKHMSSLCAVSMSTKKGQRNKGYVGEKGNVASI